MVLYSSLLYNNSRDSAPIHFQYSVTSQSIVSRLGGSLPVWFAQLYYKSSSHYILLHYIIATGTVGMLVMIAVWREDSNPPLYHSSQSPSGLGKVVVPDPGSSGEEPFFDEYIMYEYCT